VAQHRQHIGFRIREHDVEAPEQLSGRGQRLVQVAGDFDPCPVTPERRRHEGVGHQGGLAGQLHRARSSV
jgi:hypothetical protein